MICEVRLRRETERHTLEKMVSVTDIIQNRNYYSMHISDRDICDMYKTAVQCVLELTFV